MASVLNSFGVLVPEEQQQQSNQQAQAGSAKNKKKNKKKQQEANGGDAQHSPMENGQHAAPAPAPAAPSKQQPAAPEAWERAAREARAPESKRALWRDWLAMADSSAKPKFKSSNGTLMDFKTAMLECRALELSIEGVLLLGPSVDSQLEGLLAQLLARFLSFEGDANGPASLASTLVHLSSLLATEGPDTRGAACRAVQGLVASLRQTTFSKATSPEPQAGGAGNQAVRDWVSRMSGIDKQIEQQQGILQKMASAGRGAVTRDLAASAKTIFTLLEEKAALLQPSSLPSASGSQPQSAAAKQALANLADFEALVSSHLRDASSGRGGKAGGQAGGSALSGFKREEMLLAQQAEAVAAQIRSLEAQLRSLYSQQAEIADKSALLHEQQANTFDTVGGKGKGKGSQAAVGGGRGAAHFQQELDAIRALSAWAGPSQLHSSSLEQVMSAQARAASLPLQLMHSGQYYLEAALSALSDVPGKISFCRQRLSHAERLIKLGAKAQDQEKLRQDAEKLLDDSLKGADELLRSSVQVVADMAQHSQAVMQQMPDHTAEATTVLQHAEQLGADIRALYTQVQSSLTSAATAPPTPAPQQPQQQQPPRTPIQPTTPTPPPAMPASQPPLPQHTQPPTHFADPQVQHQPTYTQPLPQQQTQQPPQQPQQQQQQQQQDLPQRPNQGRRGKAAAAAASTPPQQQQQQQQNDDAHAAPHSFTFSSPRTPAAAPRHAHAAVPTAVVPPPTPGSSDASSPPMQQGAAPVTPAPVPVTAPVVPHDHMHAPPPNSPLLGDPFTQPSAYAPTFFPPAPPSVSPEVLAANGGFEPAAPPVPPPAPSPSAAAASRAAASAAATRPAQARPAAKPQTLGRSKAYDAAQEMLQMEAAAAKQKQQAASRPTANGNQPRRPPAVPAQPGAPAAVGVASADANAAQPAAPPKPPAQPPRSWAKPVAVEAPPLSDEPTPAEAARLAAEKEGKAGNQEQQGGGKGGGKKRAPRA